MYQRRRNKAIKMPKDLSTSAWQTQDVGNSPEEGRRSKNSYEGGLERETWAASGATVWGEGCRAWWTATTHLERKSKGCNMNESQSRQKFVPSRIFLVKMLARFVLPEIWTTFSVVSWTHSWMEFLRNSICLATLDVILYSHLMQASLSLYRIVGESELERWWSDLDTLQQRFLKLMAFLDVMLVARILALQELSDVRSWSLPSHPMGPPLQKTIPPFILRNLKRGRSVPSTTALPICEPQHALL